MVWELFLRCYHSWYREFLKFFFFFKPRFIGENSALEGEFLTMSVETKVDLKLYASEKLLIDPKFEAHYVYSNL